MNRTDYFKVPKAISNDGYSFASKLEAALYQQLKLQKIAGEIKEIKMQPNVMLTKYIKMIPDFLVEMAIDTKIGGINFFAGECVYHEAKGYDSDVYKLKRNLWRTNGPGKLVVWKGTYRQLKYHETIISECLSQCD